MDPAGLLKGRVVVKCCGQYFWPDYNKIISKVLVGQNPLSTELQMITKYMFIIFFQVILFQRVVALRCLSLIVIN